MHLAGTHAAEAATQATRGTTSPSRNARRLLTHVALASGLVTAIGCGASYRPVVSAINPVGPAGQPTKYAVAISSTGPSSPGLVTLVDFSGDTVLITASIGVNPQYLALNSGGNTGYTINSDGTVNIFDISPTLQTRNVETATLSPGSAPVSITPLSAVTYIVEPGRSSVGQFSGGLTPSLQQELPVAPNPVYVVGLSGASRYYAISQGATGGQGVVAAIEAGTNTISSNIPVGRGPVYGVTSTDGKRAFILNRTDGTVTVINAQTNQLDTPATANPIPVGVAPVWADLAPTRSELAVANAGDGINPGSLSIINIPLCSVNALPNNPNCNSTNPVDAGGFGQVLANIAVGINPVVVAVLSDGTRAYVANAGNPSLPCAAVPVLNVSTGCTVSVVNLTTNTVTATIPVHGHPSFLAATVGTPTGKVYVTSKDSTDLTVIRTDTDTVQTYIPLQGSGIQVRVTQQ